MSKNNSTIFQGCIPALMTPCSSSGEPEWETLVEAASQLMSLGMDGVVYCGSMGDWPLLSNEQRMDGCLLYTSPSPRDGLLSRMPSSA